MGLPANEFMDRFDGSKWRRFDISGGSVILTAEGQRITQQQPEVLRALRQYKIDIKESVRPETARRRYYLKSGGNADIFNVIGTDLVVKENSPNSSYSLWSAIDRMDYLYSICESCLPPHIRVPKHLAVILSRDLQKQYMVIEKINAGLNVADILNPDIDPITVSTIVEHFKGQMSFDQIKNLIVKKYLEAKELLDVANQQCYQQGIVPFDELLTDWARGNVLVDFDTPTPDTPFTLWIIDQ